MDQVKIGRHPIHPMLVTIPVGLWVFSLVCDLVALRSDEAAWAITAYYTLGGGIAGALVASLPGFYDLSGLRQGPERRIGMLHAFMNLAILGVQSANFWLRSQPSFNADLTLGLSLLSVAALVISGALGGHLVHALGVTQPGHLTDAEARARVSARERELQTRT